MKVLNIHKRVINRPKDEVLDLFNTLSLKEDRLWPVERWPAMKFKNGLKLNAQGGHGPIRYKVVEYRRSGLVAFEFQKPHGFNGTHKFEVMDLMDNKAEIIHTLQMKTTGMGTLIWLLALRWLHDALLEDAFDKVENQLCNGKKKSEWNLWVKILRRLMRRNPPLQSK